MKKLVLVSVFLISSITFADSTDIANQINADKSCVCNGLPANLPVVGLFHTSNWGTSALKVFPIHEFNDPSAMDKCLQLLKQLQEIEICK